MKDKTQLERLIEAETLLSGIWGELQNGEIEDGIMQSSETSGAVEYSKHLVGFHARCAMEEYMRWLEEVWAERKEE